MKKNVYTHTRMCECPQSFCGRSETNTMLQIILQKKWLQKHRRYAADAEHQVSGKHGTRSLSLWNPRSKESLVKQKQKPVAVIPSTMAALLILLPRGLSLSEGGLYEQRKMLINGLTEQFHVSST